MIQDKIPGSIVNVSSQVVLPFASCLSECKHFFNLKASQAALKDHLVYCGTKAALDMVSRVMALELGPHKVIFHLKEKPLILCYLWFLGLVQFHKL
jgi:L-xylulose reductase